MSTQKRLTVAILMALLVATVMPLSVLAQDEVPPQTDAPVVVEEDTVTEEPVVDEPTVEDPAVEETAVSEILEQLPEDTALVFVDEEGEALPLVSTEAAEVLAAPDPYFTIGTTTYRFFGAAGACAAGGYAADCFDDSATPIQDAIDYLSIILKTKPTDGNIYVESGAYIEDVYVDGSAWTTAGGDIPDYLGIIGAGSGSTTLTGSFSIYGMNAFTLSGFTVTTDSGDAIYISDNTGALQLKGLYVTSTSVEASGIRVDGQTGDVNFTGVNSTNENGIGVYINVLSGNVNLDNVAANDSIFGGASISVDSGNITVSDSEFLNNGYDGLYVSTDSGNITLNNVTATGNGDNGVYISGGSFLLKNNAVQSITSVSTGANVNVICGNYSDNGGYGLVLGAGGETYLGGPVLSGNGLGEYNLYAGTVSFGECPKLVDPEQNLQPSDKDDDLSPQIPVTGQVCNGEKKVVLEPGDGFGIFQNLCGLDLQLKEVTNDILPGALPTGASYITGMNTDISMAGKAVTVLPVGGKIKLRFPIPAGVDEASLAVLFWNGTAWVEVPGGEMVDGFYEIGINEPGNYVLASQ